MGSFSCVIDVRNLYKSYSNGVRTVVFEDANMKIYMGEIVGLFAPSGYGKSTLIYLIAGLEKPDKGDIFVAGKNIVKMNERELALFRRKHIGIVFQFFNLIPTLTAIENVMLPMRLLKVDHDEAYSRARELLKIVGLESDVFNKFPHQLSGGQQQRVAIARALANDPDIVLADEPTGNLDEKNAIRIFELFKELNDEKGVTFLIATHDVEHARSIVTRALTIKDKKIVEMM